MFIGTNQEKTTLMREVIPIYLTNEMWIDNIKLQYDAKTYNNMREALAEAMDKKYIVNVEAIRNIRDGILFQHATNGSKPMLTKKGERFLKHKR
ncbi:MAG: hypothetical protein ACERKZ_20455 [Lachnotalea sp.]